MPISYRPQNFAPTSSGDVSGGGSGTTELSHAGLSAGLESQLASPSEVSKAHQFFQPNLDVGFTTSGLAGHEVSTLPLASGIDSHALAAIPAAGEPISPLIQLIMKLPGMGAINSLLDALAAFFMPGTHLMTSLDLSTLAQQAQSAVTSLSLGASEHLPISLSLLPSHAPIFQSLGIGTPGFNYLSGKLAAGGFEQPLGALSRNPLNVSGQLNLQKPQFEPSFNETSSLVPRGLSGETSQLTSGAALSNQSVGEHLAGNHRLFTDRIDATSPGTSQSSSMPTGSQTTVGLSHTVPLSNWPGSMHAGASIHGHHAEALLPVAQIKDGVLSGPALSQTVAAHLGAPSHPALDGNTTLGPSGAVGLESKQLLVSDSLPAYRPVVGGSQALPAKDITYAKPDSSLSFSAQSGTGSSKLPVVQASSAESPTTIAGLKAKQLTLPGVKAAGTASPHAKPVVDHIAHQSRGNQEMLSARGGKAVDQIAHQSPHKPSEQPLSLATRQTRVPSTSSSELAVKNAQGIKQNLVPASKHNEIAQSQPVSTPEGALKTTSESSGTSYTVRAGDCLWNIARNHLGSAVRWQEIYKLNSDLLGSNPHLIQPGTTIKMPGVDSQLLMPGDNVSKYVVQPGDNLWEIAQSQLGDSKRWGELYRLNASTVGPNPKLILPAQELTLPNQPQLAGAVGPTTQQTLLQPVSASQVPSASLPPATQAGAMDSTMSAPSQFNGHPVVSPTAFNQGMPGGGAGAAQAAILPAGKASPAAASSLVSSSLRPDLSFLTRKR
ncbi:MAG: LysM peptidoglycan-binding domain-containing protein [Candidatus Melainabacteria bacterium]|nr:LysM peptidoglycan-binding domain-containing protein [Candidatus Melainabacteria bacterium]